MIGLLAAVNVLGAKESTGINVTLAVHRLPHPAAAGADRRRSSCSRPRCWSTTSTSASRPSGATSCSRSRSACSPTRASRPSRTWPRRQGRGDDDPGGDQPRADRRVRDLLHAARRRALGAAGHADGRRRVPDPARADRGGGRLRRRPGARRGQEHGPRHLPGPTEVYVGLLAATILFLATNAGIIGVSRLVYSMGIHRQMPDALRRLHPRYRTPWIGILVFSRRGDRADPAGPGDAAGQRVLVRRAAVASRWRTRRSRGCAPRGRTPCARTAGPGNVRIGSYDAPMFALVGGTFTAIAFVVIVVLNPGVAAIGIGWLLVGIVVYAATAAATGSTSPRPTRWRSRSRWSTTRRSTTRCSSTSATN